MRDLLSIILLLLISLIALALFTQAAHAENATNQSYVIVNETVYPLNPVYRIEQGQDVYINDTIDISGQGWGTGVAWYGKYSEYSDPQYIRMFTGYKRDVQLFWIDPSIFEDRWGMWYQYYGTNATERNGNLAAFNVIPGRKHQNTTTFQNGTVITSAFAITNVTMTKEPPKEVILPDITIADYLVARGDSMDTGFDRVWVFGRASGLYGNPGFVSIDDVNSFEIGSYRLVSQTSGQNGIWEVEYDRKTESLVSPWRKVEPVSIYGIQPLLVFDRFKEMVTKGDDRIQTYKLEVQDPEITINSIDEVAPGNRYDIRFLGEGTTLLDVRGYTNTANNTRLLFTLDPDAVNETQSKYGTYTTTAIRTSPGNMSYYRIYIPINKNQMQNGMHTIKAQTNIGGFVYADFPVSELPPDSYIPNASIKYIGNRSPWVPTPTPEVIVKTEITKETVVVTETVVVRETPSQEAVNAATYALATDIVKWACVIVAVVAGLVYIATIVWRGRKK